MKTAMTLALFAALSTGSALAQDRAEGFSRYHESTRIETKADGRTGFHIWDTTGFRNIYGPRPYHIDMAAGKTPAPGDDERLGDMLWNNMAVAAGLPLVGNGYIYLDWGKLQPTASGLPDEVIDGFTFMYSTNSVDPEGESLVVHYYDSCTGWSNLGIHEAAFAFSGLPNCLGLPSMPPGWVWVMSINVDLEDSGYEFILNGKIGQGHVFPEQPASGRTGLALGQAPNRCGNGPTGTQHAFDVYYPNLTYNGTWWACSGMDHWCTWPGALYGPGGAAQGMTYYGVSAAGNDASLYATGAWIAGSGVRFLLRRNQSPLAAWLCVSHDGINRYLPSYDITRLIAGPAGCAPFPMAGSLSGDFASLAAAVPPAAASMTIYFQAALGDAPLLQPPLDASNGVRAN